MHSTKNSIFSAAFTVCLAVLTFAEPWDASVCVRSALIGSSTAGYPFILLAEESATVSKIRLWRTGEKGGSLRGISLGFSDGTSQSAGTSQRTTRRNPFRNDTRARLARVDFVTEKNSWGYGVADTRALTSHAVAVGSGVLVGFQGRAGSGLHQLAPIFLKSVSRARIENIVFDAMPGPNNLRPITLADGFAAWEGKDWTYTFSGSQTRETSSSFNLQNSNQLAIGASVAFDGSGIAKWGGSATWSVASQTSRDRSETKTQLLTWSASVDINEKNPSVRCTAITMEGRVSTGWIGTLTTIIGGRAVRSPISGIYEEISYSQVHTTCGPPPDSSSSTQSTPPTSR
ncbi:hypothetical protein N0V88_002768 [Collariella sp. IMI 366227]|nr:hypothetical protein N0V88_002768 [Collariella sp. IMI 366227]